jgi:coenzyme PQQ synthesis protein D (PqqD)
MARFVRSPDVVARRIAGELVLVPIASRTENPLKRTANFYVLNGTGELLWAQLESPADVPALARQLVTHFRVDEVTAQGDVERFLSELAACGAVETVEQT